MRLINTDNLILEEYPGDYSGRYAILSHTWEDGEISCQEMQIATQDDGHHGWVIKQKPGYRKILEFARVAAADGFDYIWVDTCCIDKTSSAELSESINCMFRWYSKATRCYVYLADVPNGGMKDLRDALKRRIIYDSDSDPRWSKHQYHTLAWPSRGAIDHPFYQSRWWTRGWTLQELIAPIDLIFYCSDWTPGLTKSDMLYILYRITGIPESVLETGDCSFVSVADRMRWASARTTTRIEDMAYCLLGIFDVNMPMLYGESDKAFLRLQEEICKVSDDQSIFAWRQKSPGSQESSSSEGSSTSYRGLFARSPEEFAINSVRLAPIEPASFIPPSGSTSIGYNAQFPLIPLTDVSKLKGIVPVIDTSTHDAKNEYLAILNAKALQSWHRPGMRDLPGHRVAILLKALSPGASTRQYVRVKPSTVYTLTQNNPLPSPVSLYIRHNIRIPHNHASRRWGGFVIDASGSPFLQKTPFTIWSPHSSDGANSGQGDMCSINNLIRCPEESKLEKANGVIAIIQSTSDDSPFVAFLGRSTRTGNKDGPGSPILWVRKGKLDGPPEEVDFHSVLKDSLPGVKVEDDPPQRQLKFEEQNATIWFTISWLPKLVDDMLVCSFSIKGSWTPPEGETPRQLR